LAERLFEISFLSTEAHLRAALSSWNSLVRRSAREELDLRSAKAKNDARLGAVVINDIAFDDEFYGPEEELEDEAIF
jgi:hypothetical protein